MNILEIWASGSGEICFSGSGSDVFTLPKVRIPEVLTWALENFSRVQIDRLRVVEGL